MLKGINSPFTHYPLGPAADLTSALDDADGSMLNDMDDDLATSMLDDAPDADNDADSFGQ